MHWVLMPAFSSDFLSLLLLAEIGWPLFFSWNFFTLCPCFCPTNPGYACFYFMFQLLVKLYRTAAPMNGDGDVALWIQPYRDSNVFGGVNNTERLSQAVLLPWKAVSGGGNFVCPL